MRDSFVHYHVPPGYICSKTALRSQRKGLLLRLWARPLVSKCVIIFAFGAVCLTEWPSDLLHFLIVPGDRGDAECLTAAESSSNIYPCGQLFWHDDAFIQNGSPWWRCKMFITPSSFSSFGFINPNILTLWYCVAALCVVRQTLTGSQ